MTRARAARREEAAVARRAAVKSVFSDRATESPRAWESDDEPQLDALVGARAWSSRN